MCPPRRQRGARTSPASAPRQGDTGDNQAERQPKSFTTKSVSSSCQDTLKFTKSVSFPSAFRVTCFRLPVSGPVTTDLITTPHPLWIEIMRSCAWGVPSRGLERGFGERDPHSSGSPWILGTFRTSNKALQQGTLYQV